MSCTHERTEPAAGIDGIYCCDCMAHFDGETWSIAVELSKDKAELLALLAQTAREVMTQLDAGKDSLQIANEDHGILIEISFLPKAEGFMRLG